MSDRFYLIPMKQLLNWIFKEYEEKKEIFGISEKLFFTPTDSDPFSFDRYDQHLETPIGVAAGPHTQMAQNIISAWLTGARYIELKTVQTLDEIEVSKPCIDMEDEGYNCEWSQELTLLQSYEEYVKAWIIIHILKHKFGHNYKNGKLGMIFNMSVGYSYEGILNDNVQNFLNKMEDSSELISKYVEEIEEIYPEIKNIKIPTQLSDNLTLSTMHGCPPDEVEKIAKYLIEERNYHTTVKLNPTLLGAEQLRFILNEKMGFINTTVPDIAFEHDLKYDDAKGIIERLLKLADKNGVKFGLKLTNTLEVENHKDFFPESEKMMYMSGRSLHPISINLADKLQKEFNGKLDISFSAGADQYNIASILGTGIKPITVSSDILKPGGYGRLKQYVDNIKNKMSSYNAKNIDQYILAIAKNKDLVNSYLKNLDKYSKEVLNDKQYHKNLHPWESIKGDRKLKKFDCIKAPCVTTCPTEQDIPTYIALAGEGRYKEALDVIKYNNPFPNSTGMACDHKCQSRCTRINYDSPLLIRDIKRFIAFKEEKFEDISSNIKKNGKLVSIIGGGPSGLSAAYFLAKAGFEVTVYESYDKVGGMLTHALPDFRAEKERVKFDIDRIESLGVKIIENNPIKTEKQFKELYNNSDYIYIAVGARKGKNINIDGENLDGVWDFLQFLDDVKQNRIVEAPENIVVIGGGNSAMDAARTALRVQNGKGKTKILYRRTKREMPADLEELEAVLDENIEIIELVAPLKIIESNGKVEAVECVKMELGEADSSGRRRPKPVKNSEHIIKTDWIIKAIGQDIVLDFLPENIEKTGWGSLKVDFNTGETSDYKVFAGGDVIHGPASIIKAVADGKKFAHTLMVKNKIEPEPYQKPKLDIDIMDLKFKKSFKIDGEELPLRAIDKRDNFEMVNLTLKENILKEEAKRCLQCDQLCNICVTVCPNRANISYEIKPISYILKDVNIVDNTISYSESYNFSVEQDYQIINIGDFCNECGNCTMFCPTSGSPYLEKPKFYLTDDSYNNETSGYRYVKNNNNNILKMKVNGIEYILSDQEDKDYYEYETDCWSGKISKLDLSIFDFSIKKDGTLSMKNAAELVILLNGIKKELLYIG